MRFVTAKIGSCAIALAATMGAASAQVPSPLGAEIQVNVYSLGDQLNSSVARDADGDFVVVWISPHDGDDYGIFGRRFNSLGNAVATEFQVNAYTTGEQQQPWVAMSASGAFVVVWASPQDGDSLGVFARRFNASGSALGVDLQVNTYVTGLQFQPVVASEADGDFIVVWDGPGATDTNGGVFGRRFTSAGTPSGAEFRVNTTTNSFENTAALDLAANGQFVVAWQALGDGSVYAIFGQRFDSTGIVGPEFQANVYVTDTQGVPAVGVDDDGDFVLVWHSQVQDSGTFGVFARRYNSAGTPAGVELQVNTYVTGNQLQPAIAMDADGDFVIAWTSPQDSNNVFLRRFKSPGVPVTGEIQVNTIVTNSQSNPALAGGPDGDFVATWASFHNGTGEVRAQRFDVPIGIDVDGDGLYLPLTDGLLLLRFAFGFTGNTLISGAVGPGCTRCDVPSITAHLQGLL